MPYVVYVIRLKDEVFTETKFARANPNRREDKPCLYVGSTFHSPEHRYEQHITGVNACAYVEKYHDGIHQRLTKKNPSFDTRDEAEVHEAELAERLRRKGFAVWFG